MTTLAKNANSKTFVLPVQWNGRRYSESSDIPDVAAPTELSATASGTSINLSWTDNTDGAAQTIIQQSPNGSTGWTTIATKAAGVTAHSDTSLASGTYYYRAAANYGSMTSDYSASANATVTADGGLLFSNGFETGLTGFSSPLATPAYARVTNDPDTGTYCVRGNFINGKSDSIAGITGSGMTINLVVPSLRANTPNACVVKYRFRVDPANYAADTGGLNYIKSAYFSDVSSTSDTSDAFWPAISHQSGYFRYIGRNSSWLNGTLTGWPPGNVSFSASHGAAVNTFDGNYHTFEIRFNYGTGTFRMFVDDLPIYGANYFTDGLFNMGSTFRFDRARIFFASSIDVRNSTDGVGIAGGWQLDNVEVYDGPT